MNSRWAGNPSRMIIALVAFVIGSAPGLCLHAQETEIPSLKAGESKPQDVAAESADSNDVPKTSGDAASDKASDKAAGGSGILDLDIEQLGKVQAKVPTAFDTEVTTVTAHKSSIGKSAAAVFVITNEMIRRSGATSVPECFRMVPGMQVAKIGPSKWAITARGFNNQFANKLLVLVDGRTVYTTFSNGVYWETQDLVLQDIERIEVIRGPGATIWGANAVNGVINIITKTSGDTQGGLVSAGGGDQDRTINSVRFGGKLGDDATFRVYGRQFDRAAGFNPVGVNDAWNQARGGFRIDAENPSENDTFTLQGDIYGGTIGETSVLPISTDPFFQTFSKTNPLAGGDLLGRWTRVVDDENTWMLQSYFDRVARKDVDFNLGINTYDLEFRQFLKHSGTHTFTWGGGYRLTSDNLQGNRPEVEIVPKKRNWDQANVFVQEEMPFLRDDLKLTVGSKFLYYYFTGFEYQPSTRLLWEIDDKQVLWGTVSRAVRTPSRGEENANLGFASPPLPILFQVNAAGRSLMSENLLAYELGYRKQINDRLSFELATFFNDYRNLINVVPSGFIPGLPTIVTGEFLNSQDAQTYGAEFNGQWEIHQKWRIRGWCSWMNMNVNGHGNIDYAGLNPRNQAYLMSSWDLPRKFEFDLMPRYVGNLPGPKIPAYSTLDARLGWRPNDRWDCSIIGQNLLAPHHLEFLGNTTLASAVNRGVYAQAVWRF